MNFVVSSDHVHAQFVVFSSGKLRFIFQVGLVLLRRAFFLPTQRLLSDHDKAGRKRSMSIFRERLEELPAENGVVPELFEQLAKGQLFEMSALLF